MEFNHLDASEEEIERALAIRAMKLRKDRDGRVCICGHGMAYHSGSDPEVRAQLEAAGRTVRVRCAYAKSTCPCVSPHPVLTTKDIRRFMHKTAGSGKLEHALAQGIMSCNLNKTPLVWLENTTCNDCGIPCISAYAGTRNGHIAEGPSPINVFLCDDCKAKRV